MRRWSAVAVLLLVIVALPSASGAARGRQGGTGGGDNLTVLGGAGNDTINAAGVAAGSPLLTLQGEDDNDTLTGSFHVDNLFGGNGDDTIFFTPGDNVDGGAGTNTILPQ